jgi:PST family polysaccharide transporter
MGADFYPRLTAASKDHTECNRLVNEQAQISLLLAGPGMIATMTFAPLVIALFYSARFDAAVPILRWVCLGMTLRVIAWPMGFILLAKGAQQLFFWIEVGAAAVHIGAAWLFIGHLGLTGAGVAFFTLCLCHAVAIYFIVRHVTGFRWERENRNISQFFLPVVFSAFFAFYVLPVLYATMLGALLFAIGCIYSVRTLLRLVPCERVPRPLKPVLTWLRVEPQTAAVE